MVHIVICMNAIKLLRTVGVSLAAFLLLAIGAIALVRGIDREGSSPEKVLTQHRAPHGDRYYRLNAGPANAWLVPLREQEGYLLIDTGYPDDYERFIEGIEFAGIKLEEIRYLFITHAHDEHAGFAARLKRETNCTLILPGLSLPDLARGRFDWQGVSVNPVIHVLGLLYNLVKTRTFEFEPVYPDTDDIILTGLESDIARDLGIDGRFVYTPGHSADSWSLVMDDGRGFVGDAAMNMLNVFGAGYRPIFMENREQVYDSLDTLRNAGVVLLLTGHGNAFAVNQLPVYTEKADTGPGLSVIPFFLLRLLPGFLLGFYLLYILRSAPRIWRVWIYILLFVLMRDLMTPFGLWRFDGSPVFWIRFAADGGLLIVLAVSSVIMSAAIWLFEKKRGPSPVWFNGSPLMAIIAGLGGAILVAGPLLLLQLGIEPGERGGIFPIRYIPVLILFSLSGNLLEELLFRGYLQMELCALKISPRLAAILSGLFFGFCHLFLAYTVSNIGAVLVVFAVWEGIVCGLLMKRFGLLSAVLTHGLAIALLAMS